MAYAPNSTGHTILARLMSYSASKEELNAACGVHEDDEHGRRKVWFVLRALKDHGLVASNSGVNFILSDGRVAFEALERGEIYPEPKTSIRVFVGARDTGAAGETPRLVKSQPVGAANA